VEQVICVEVLGERFELSKADLSAVAVAFSRPLFN